MNLSLAHLADLRRSGLSDRQIDRCGFWTESDGGAVADLLGWQYPPPSPFPVLAIPYRLLSGEAAGYVRVKPDRPRTDDRGKPIRYESPRGVRNLCFFPPGILRHLARGRDLLVTEGEKKAAAVDQYGWPCVGLAGVNGWQMPRSAADRGTAEREPVPELADVLRGVSRVYVVFDSDAHVNKNVSLARSRLCVCLSRLGASPLVVRVPPRPDGGKRAVDDVLAESGATELRHLIRWAAPAILPGWASPGLDPEIIT
jgi:putative DNA primase/helicase